MGQEAGMAFWNSTWAAVGCGGADSDLRDHHRGVLLRA